MDTHQEDELILQQLGDVHSWHPGKFLYRVMPSGVSMRLHLA